MRVLGLLLIVIASVVPLYWYLPLFADYSASALISQYIGSVALILMAFSQLLATRMVFLEAIFGSLDRIYVLHKWVGVIALAAVLFHDTVDAEIDGLGAETWLVDLAETLGELSLYALLILAVLSIATFIPYQLWRFSHKFMGTLFALSTFHFLYMLKPVSLTEPLGIYVIAFCVVGLICYGLTLLPFRAWTGRHPYEIKEIEKTGDTVAMTLSPQRGPIKHRAGQFCFISIQLPSMTEPHPFTVSSAPNPQGELRFSIKNLGDYTRKIAQQIEVGAKVQVSKAYGHFRRVPNSKTEIWIAAGIGITPFLAWLQQAVDRDNESDVHLFYCIKGQDLAPHLDEVKRLTQTTGVTLHLIDSQVRARLSADEVLPYMEDASATQVYYCGPKNLRQMLQSTLNQNGLRHGRFHFEEFEIRSGIGLRVLLNKILKLVSFYRSKKGT